MIKMSEGRSRGMGTVSFYNSDDARRAVRILASAAAGSVSWVGKRSFNVMPDDDDDYAQICRARPK